MFANTALIVMGLLLLVQNENDGFQNLWFFLMPAILFVQSGLPIGLPFCTAYGLAATCFLWLGPLVGSTLYRRDYALFYPAAYWSFCLLMITADLFYKHYRIRQEQSEKEMEREVQATICEARQLMVSSVAAISQMIDEKDRYTSEHSYRVAEYARLIGAHMGFAGEELDAMGSDRCYRRHCDRDYIIGEFRKGSGTQFEPAAVQALVELLESEEIVVQ